MSKLINTNSKEYLNNFKSWLLGAIDIIEYTNEIMADDEKVAFTIETALKEVDHIHNEQKAIAFWLEGLPSLIDIPFYHEDILEHVARIHGIDKVPTDKERVVLDTFFYKTACDILKLNRKLNK